MCGWVGVGKKGLGESDTMNGGHFVPYHRNEKYPRRLKVDFKRVRVRAAAVRVFYGVVPTRGSAAAHVWVGGRADPSNSWWRPLTR